MGYYVSLGVTDGFPDVGFFAFHVPIDLAGVLVGPDAAFVVVPFHTNIQCLGRVTNVGAHC